MRTADSSFIVRKMRPDEVELMQDWATTEGWNPGLHTSPCFFATDPGGFYPTEGRVPDRRSPPLPGAGTERGTTGKRAGPRRRPEGADAAPLDLRLSAG
jgi:hypothetical protein